MSAKASPSSQAGALVFGTTLATISSALLPLLLVRLLGKAELAELMALVLVYDTVALVLTGGFPSTLSYYLPGRPPEERRAICIKLGWIMAALGAAAALATALLGTTGRALPGALSSSGGAEISLGPLLLLAPSLVLELPSRLVPNLLVAENRASHASAIGVVRTVLTTVATLVPVALGYELMIVAAFYSGSRILMGLSLPWAIRVCFVGAARIECPVAVRQLFRFALPLGATDVVSLLNQQFDRWLILLSFPAAAFADYQAGAWQIPVISTVAYSVGAAYMPVLVERFGRGQKAEAIEVWRGTIAKVSLVVIPVTLGFVVAARELMALLFTPAYVGAAPIFQLYAILTLGRVATFGSVIVAAGRPKYVLQAAVLSFVANVALSVPLTRLLGFLGPALGTALAFFPMVAFYIWAIARATGLPVRSIFPFAAYGKVLGLGLVSAGVALSVKGTLTASSGVVLLLTVATTLLSFSVLATLAGSIERSDWRYVASWLRLKLGS